MWIVNKLLARVLRALAGALEPEAGPAPPGEVPLDTRMALLRRRYPDAPEHWLRLVAERTTAVDVAPAEPTKRAPAPPDRQRPKLARAWLTSAPPGKHAREAAGRARREGEHVAIESRPVRGDSETSEPLAIDKGAFPPNRTAREARAARFYAFRPRFRREPAREGLPRNEEGAADTPARRATDAPSVVALERGAQRDTSGGIGSRRDEKRPATRRSEPAIVRAAPAVPRASEHRSISHPSAPRARELATPGPRPIEAAARKARDKVPELPQPPEPPKVPDLPKAQGPSVHAARGAQAPEPLARTTVRRVPASAAPEEPPWPELPAVALGSDEGARREIDVPVRGAEESGRWNALPF
jgi:hypothetical protein